MTDARPGATVSERATSGLRFYLQIQLYEISYQTLALRSSAYRLKEYCAIDGRGGDPEIARQMRIYVWHRALPAC